MTNDVSPRQFFEEGRGFLAQGDTIQASEKLYKAAEETVKELARRLDLPEWRESREKGRWTTSLLFSAVRSLSRTLNRIEVVNGWDAAWFLHVEGFHEARLASGEVDIRLPIVEELLSLGDT